jgi:protein-S-isoprenylcysteine O-methyltransferase Ste14
MPFAALKTAYIIIDGMHKSSTTVEKADQPQTRSPNLWQHLLAVIALPGLVIVLLPAILLNRFPPDQPFWPGTELHRWVLFIVALLFKFAGIALAAATMLLFARRGRGTLAPWQPPDRLVVAGPYRYMRNPMISAIICLLLGQAALFSSNAILIWTVVFSAINTVYIPLIEEPELVQRFGQEYLRYKLHVPRWLPRFSPWSDGGHHTTGL